MSEEENPNDSNAMMNLNINQAKETNNQIEINSQTNSEISKNGNLLISLTILKIKENLTLQIGNQISLLQKVKNQMILSIMKIR